MNEIVVAKCYKGQMELDPKTKMIYYRDEHGNSKLECTKQCERWTRMMKLYFKEHL